MSGKNVLCFKLLGSFQFREGGEAQWRSLESMGIKGVRKKQLAFLMCFLLNNKRLITAEELVETFWPGDSMVFRNLVQLELRNMRRNGHRSSLVVLQAMKDGQNGKPSTDTRRVERTLLTCLRAGDPFTKLNMGSFAVLLPTASVENAQKVMERVSKEFHSTYPRSKATLQYRAYPLTSIEE